MKRNRKDADFLSQFFGKNPPDPSKLSKLSTNADKFDLEVYEAILEEIEATKTAEDRLTDVVETGGSAFTDVFASLVKAMPRLLPAGEIRPSHQINRAVMGEAMGLKELDQLRSFSVGDEVAAGLGAAEMEPTIEILFDKLKEQQKLADQLQQQLEQYMQGQQDAADLDKMIQDAQAGGDQEAAQNFQNQKALIEAAQEMLKQQIEQDAADLSEQLGEQAGEIRASMRQAFRDAIEQAEELDALSTTWGLDPGTLHRMAADERIALAKRLNTEKFKRIAELLGPMERMAFAEQQRKYIHARDEVFDLEQGNDLGRILASELQKLAHPVLKREFFKNFTEHRLNQYKLRGVERIAKGGIIVMTDSSGSMNGENELWAFAVSGALLQIAKSQSRSFHGIIFSGPGAFKHFDFRDTKSIDIERVIQYMECTFGGGTDFATPLSKALDIMQEEYDKFGEVKADGVFITDGICGVSEEWLRTFKEKQAQLGFRVWGIVIGGSADSEPLKTICDGRVFTVTDLVSGNDLREMFREI